MTAQGGLLWVLAACAWLALLGVDVLCGVTGAWLLGPRLGERRARAASNVVLSVLLLCVIKIFVVAAGLRGTWPLMRIGALWTVLFAAADALLGRYAAGRSWAQILADYDVTAGGLRLLVLAVVFWGPVLAG